jgi:hypothetical protein
LSMRMIQLAMCASPSTQEYNPSAGVYVKQSRKSRA